MPCLQPFTNVLEDKPVLLLSGDDCRLIHPIHAYFYGDKKRIGEILERFFYHVDKGENSLELLEVGEKLLAKTKEHPLNGELARRVEKLKIEAGFTTELNRVEEWAALWKQSRADINKKEVTEEEKDTLKIVESYRGFEKILEDDPEVREKFFHWTLRQKNSPEIFIRCPGVTNRIIKANFGMRLSKKKIMRLNENGIVEIKCQGKWCNFSDPENEITFSHGMKKTVKEVLEVFENREYRIGDLEVQKDGICNYNPMYLGPKNQDGQYESISLEGDWWKRLDPCETLTEEQIVERYRRQENGEEISFEGEPWFASLANFSVDPEQERVEGVHSLLEIAIRNGDKYDIFLFGLVGEKFPETFLDRPKYIFSMMPGKIVYPDENGVMDTRDFFNYPVCQLKEEEVRKILDEVKKDIQSSWNDELPFHVFAKSCAKWAIEKLKPYLSDLEKLKQTCYVHPLDLSPEFPVGLILRVTSVFGRAIQLMTLFTMSLFFGGLTRLKIKIEGVTQDVFFWGMEWWTTPYPSNFILVGRNAVS